MSLYGSAVTAQAPDQVEIDGVEHAIAGVSGTGLFEPAEHGVQPFMIHTGCWRGFICTYAVAGDAFTLRDLRLGRASTIGGEPIEEGTPLLGAAAALDGGEWVFRYDAYVVPFTGTLLAGDGFVWSTYVHMGYAPAWKYERVVELAVDAGRVTARRDLSEQMAALRAEYERAAADPDGDRSDTPGWIARTFGLGYDRTFGAPKPPERPPGG